jgi:UDP:flavonoid glycosyltransferase YjiC (YdhE family)
MESGKKTILFFPFNLLSHYIRCLVLADSYDKAAYSIYFLSAVSYDHFVFQHGYKTFDCQQFDVQYVMECSKRFDFSWLNESDLEKIMLAQVEVIKELKADIVIGDVAPTLKMAATLTGTQHVSLLNGYMTRYYAHNRRITRKHFAYNLLKFLPESMEVWLTNIGENLAFKKIQQAFNVVRLKYGLQPISDYLVETEGDINLICDDPKLFPQENLPPSFKFVGPLVYQYQDEDESWLSMIPPGKRLICVTLGSTGDWKKLKFLNDPYYSKYAIVTAGDTEKVLSSAHIVSRVFVNLNQLLKRSDLMICHGGNGTIYQGILNHVYMLCLSSHFEQEWNINALEKNGYGKSAEDFTEDEWKVQIEACCIYSGNQLVKGP